jgi:transposase-like protein
MQDESSRRYLFVAIDRATRWVFVQIKKNKTAASAKAFLNAVHKACPMRIQKVLTDNGKEFTDRLFASRARQPTGEGVSPMSSKAIASTVGWTWSRRCCGAWPCTTINCLSQP